MKLLLLALVLASAAADVKVVLENRFAEAPGNIVIESRKSSSVGAWQLGARADPRETMTVYAMMKHEKEDVKTLEKVLAEVSNPKSSRYGHHYTLAGIEKLAPISHQKLETVVDFFDGAVVKMNPNKDMLTIELEVSKAEKLFSTQVHEFSHVSGVKLLRVALDYSLPQHVADAVYIIGDLVALPSLPVKKSPPVEVEGPGNWPNACSGLRGCAGLVTPAVLKKRYNIDGSGMDAANNSMAVAEFQGQYFKQKDLDIFSDGCKVNVTVDNIIGGNRQKVGVESELDIQYIKGVSPDISLTVQYSAQFSLFDWMSKVNGQDGAPWVQSVSYGNDEAQQTSDAYMYSCNVQFMKAGIRGVSVLFASGDQGVCGREGCGYGNRKRFNPDFPGGSPYITVVGGTDFLTYDIGEESAWSGGGGGFSDTFDIPEWQADAVKAYKNNPSANLPPQSMWNNTGRGYPDVSALGGQKTSYCVVAYGNPTGVAGTSASCPVVGAIFSRLNGLRLKAGRSPLGFLNPFIYQNADAFNDVKHGCNTGEPGNEDCFQAIEGWDAATGVGTPDYSKLASLV